MVRLIGVRTGLHSRLASRVALSICLALAGCGKEQPSATPSVAGPAKSVGVSLLTMQHQFYQELRHGLEQSAKNHGLRLVIVSAEFDSSRQANQIDEFIAGKMDAIVVCPCDSRSVGASIASANQANIPVFTADIANNSALGKVVSHIASDNVQGGREAARLLTKALDGKGDVVVLSHPEVASVGDRVRGFKEQIGGVSGIRVVAELSAEGKRDKAVKVMEDLLQSRSEISGVFAINDDTALGALAAIEAAGKADRIKIVGYDATPEARAKIAARSIYGDVVQNPRRIGELTAQSIADYFAGRTPPAVVPVEVGVYTGEASP